MDVLSKWVQTPAHLKFICEITFKIYNQLYDEEKHREETSTLYEAIRWCVKSTPGPRGNYSSGTYIFCDDDDELNYVPVIRGGVQFRKIRLILMQVLFREDCTADDLIDVILANRVYLPCIYVYNKIDQISIQEVDRIAREPNSVVVRLAKAIVI